MNDEDKETFDKWLSDASNHYADALAYEFERHLCFVSWQAACEYKDKELETYCDYVNHMKSFSCEIEKLQAENKKLREALNKSIEGHRLARMVLREACFDGAADDMTDYVDVTMKALKEVGKE